MTGSIMELKYLSLARMSGREVVDLVDGEVPKDSVYIVAIVKVDEGTTIRGGSCVTVEVSNREVTF